MFIPSYYFYYEDSSEEDYGSLPSNQLSVPRFIANQPCWKKPFGKSIKIKKTLIVNISRNDFDVISQHHSRLLENHLDLLEADVFDLYVFCGQALISFGDIKRGQRPWKPSELSNQEAAQRAAAFLECTAASIYIIDIKEIEHFLDANEEEQDYLAQQEHLSLTRSNLSSTTFMNLLQKTQHRLQTLTIAHCENLNEVRLSKSLSFPQLTFFSCVNHTLSDFLKTPPFFLSNNLPAQDIELILDRSPHLKRIGLEGNLIKINQRLQPYKELIYLCLHNVLIDQHELNQVLQNNRNTLIELELIGTNTIALPEQLILPKIQKLILGNPASGCTLDLPYTPAIETLYIVNPFPDLGAQSISINSGSLSKLRFLVLENITLSADSFSHLINSTAPHLEHLCLTGETIVELNLEDSISFPNLQILGLNASMIRRDNKVLLLNKSPNLKCISLRETDVLPLFVSQSYLEELELIRVAVNHEALGCMFPKTPYLKKLSLNWCNLFDYPAVSLLRLTHLSLIGCIFKNPAVLKSILKAAPNLKELDLRDCKRLSKKEVQQIIAELSLSHLKIIGLAFLMNPILESTPVFGSPTSNSFDTEIFLDADTHLNNTSIEVDRIFYHKDPQLNPSDRDYRLEIIHEAEPIKAPCSINKAFRLKKSGDLALELRAIQQESADCFNKLQNKPNCFYGIQKIPLSNQWQSLASLSPYDLISNFHLNEDVDVEIHYSKRDLMYWIRSKEDIDPKEVCIDFLMERRTPSSIPVLPDEIQRMINDLRERRDGGLELQKDNPTGEDYLEALLNQPVGSCRHRSLLFKTWMKTHYPNIPVHIVNNKDHSFVELCYQEQWQTYDLGGYPNTKKINENNRPKSVYKKAEKPKLMRLSSETNKSDRKKYFTVDVMNKVPPDSGLAYARELLNQNEPNILVHTQSVEDAQGLGYHCAAYCYKEKRPCFVVHKPEELLCSRYTLTRNEDNTGRIKTQPGGALYEFLQQNQREKPLIIVNYDAFDVSEIVRFNSLLDTPPAVDGTILPPGTQILGLKTPSRPGAYQGSDFDSRFDVRLNCTIEPVLLKTPSIYKNEAPPEEAAIIELYQGLQWEETLLGGWRLEGQHFYYKEGLLAHALHQKALILSNPPKKNHAFESFWQKAMLRGYIDWEGKRYPLPDGFSLYSQTKIPQSKALPEVEAQVLNAPPLVLNPTTFLDFLGLYRLEGKELYHNEGLIEQRAKKELIVDVSHPLNDNQWALFHDLCEQHQVACKQVKDIKLKTPMKFLCTTDVEFSVQHLKAKHPKAIVIDITEVTSADLFGHITGSYDDEHRFSFNAKPGFLEIVLNRNGPLILKGYYSEELSQRFSQWVLDQQNAALPPIYLVSEQKNPVPSIDEETLTIKPEDRKALWDSIEPNSKHANIDWADPWVKCLTQAQQGEKAWDGLTSIPCIEQKYQQKIDLDQASNQSSVFNEFRLTQVENKLKQSPIVFLAGKTGVGKTQFIHEVFQAKHPNLHVGEHQIKTWAKDTRPGLKTLFIDEANLTDSQWLCFEGLFYEPKGILVDGEWIELSQEHKVVFAANPLQYGGERHLPKLLERRGGSVIFEPLPKTVLYHESLKPILDPNYPEQEAQKAIIEPLFAVMDFLTHCNPQEVFISPRELQSMVLLTLSSCLKYKTDISTTAAYYAYHLGKTLVPECYQDSFIHQFKAPRPEALEKAEVFIHCDSFYFNEASREAYYSLCDHLQLRSLRRQHPQSNLRGGLGGVVLEGPPGIGKTTLVIETLLNQGLKKGNPQEDNTEQDVFYILPASMALTEKKELLLKAFHEGAVVVMDELNSAPMLERLLNDLLMGKAPDGTVTKKPGFLLTGTQNPPTFAGRKTMGSAQKRRLDTRQLPEYTPLEMKETLCLRKVPEHTAKELVDDYLDYQEAAFQNPKLPQLCFRDLIKRGDEAVTSHEKDAINTRLIKQFFKQYSLKKNLFGFFSHFKKEPTQLEDILKYAQDHKNSTTYKACKQLDWLNADGDVCSASEIVKSENSPDWINLVH
jgi:hypothetical protein